jgi:protein-disulfide isomerase-like protein with CxxC motif
MRRTFPTDAVTIGPGERNPRRRGDQQHLALPRSPDAAPVWTPVTSDSRPTAVDFWFDPVCPWTWLTSRWMLEVRKTRPIDVTWHVMSLAVLNEGRLDQLAPANRELMGQAWAPVRVLIAAQEAFGPNVVEALYTALGTRYYPQRQPKTRSTIEAALREAGLPTHLADAGENDSYDEALRASHREGITLVGADVGSPIIAIPGSGFDTAKIAFFGPVVNPAPKGEAAARLWDGTVAVASTPGFYEIKRTRTVGPIFD